MEPEDVPAVGSKVTVKAVPRPLLGNSAQPKPKARARLPPKSHEFIENSDIETVGEFARKSSQRPSNGFLSE